MNSSINGDFVELRCNRKLSISNTRLDTVTNTYNLSYRICVHYDNQPNPILNIRKQTACVRPGAKKQQKKTGSKNASTPKISNQFSWKALFILHVYVDKYCVFLENWLMSLVRMHFYCSLLRNTLSVVFNSILSMSINIFIVNVVDVSYKCFEWLYARDIN